MKTSPKAHKFIDITLFNYYKFSSNFMHNNLAILSKRALFFSKKKSLNFVK